MSITKIGSSCPLEMHTPPLHEGTGDVRVYAAHGYAGQALIGASGGGGASTGPHATPRISVTPIAASGETERKDRARIITPTRRGQARARRHRPLEASRRGPRVLHRRRRMT